MTLQHSSISAASLFFAAAFVFSLPAYAETPPVVQDRLFSGFAKPPKEGSGKWEGSFGMGLTLRQGNTNSIQGTLTGNAVRAMRESRFVLSILGVRGASNGRRDQDNLNVEGRAERNLDRNWFGFAGAGIERDTQQDLALRKTVSSGVGYRLLQEKEASLNLYSGLAYSMENNVTAPDSRGAEVLLGLDGSVELSPTSRFSHKLVVIPDSAGGSGARYAMQADVTTAINSRLGLQVALLHKYRDQVAPTKQHADTILFTGVTAKF